MDEFVLPAPELEVEVYFLNTKEGGRKHNIPLNYRSGTFFYDGDHFIALYQFINNTKGILGESSDLLVQFISSEFHMGKFYEGKEFLIIEGSKTVGKGKIKKVLRKDYEVS